MTREEYIIKYSKLVLDAVKGTPLFASVMMAQAILESSDKEGRPGNSILAKICKNHFGIKADLEWSGEKVSLKTYEVIKGNRVEILAAFRIYANDAHSFNDRVKFLLENRRYANAGVFSAPTSDEQAVALQKAGYATNPSYANILIKLMKRYNLYKLDSLSQKLVLAQGL